MSVAYHINRDGQNMGPYDLQDLQTYYKTGQLVDSDLAWAVHLTDWALLGSLPERRVEIQYAPTQAPQIPIAPVAPPRPEAAAVQSDSVGAQVAILKQRLSSEGLGAVPKLVGPKVLAAFGVFFICSQMGFIQVGPPGAAVTFGSFYSFISSSGLGLIAYLFACLAFMVPLLVLKKEAWLSYCAPIAVVVITILMAWDQYHTLVTSTTAGLAAITEGNPMMKRMFEQQAAAIPSFWSLVKLQIGAYLMVLSAGYIAYLGLKNYLSRRSSTV